MNDFYLAPQVIVDFRVAVYQILHHYTIIHEKYDQRVRDAWLKAAWALYVNRGFTGFPYYPHSVVVVDDSSPYWRTKYLSDRGFPEYKGGRPSKAEEWYLVNAAGKEYVCDAKSPIHFLSFPGYEADDIAAAIVRLRVPRHILLHTIDSDWMGLIKDSENPSNKDKKPLEILQNPEMEQVVLWANSAHWVPRVRDFKGAYDHQLKRAKIKMENPTDIWTLKVDQGDKSDNLIPGSPLEVIHLLEPPKEHDLLEVPHLKEAIWAVAGAPGTNSSLDHLEKAEKFFRKNGFVPPLVDYTRHPVSFPKN